MTPIKPGEIPKKPSGVRLSRIDDKFDELDDWTPPGLVNEPPVATVSRFAGTLIPSSGNPLTADEVVTATNAAKAAAAAVSLISPVTVAGPLWPSPVPVGAVTNLALKRISTYADGDWRTLSAWPTDGFLQSTVGQNASLAFSVHELGQYGSGQKTFRARRDNDDAEEDFYGGEYGSTRFFEWAGSNDVYLVKLYDQLGSGKDLVQPNETRQYKIAASGAVIDWVKHSGGSGADYFLLNSGLTKADNLSAFFAYSSRKAAAADTSTATLFAMGNGNNSWVQAVSSSSGAAGVTGEGIVLDVRQSNTGLQRIGATYGASAGQYDRDADTLEILGVGFTSSGVWLYQDGSEITLDITSTASPPDVDTGDFSPSSGTYTDIIRVGALNVGGSPVGQEDSTFEAIVFYTTDEEANQSAITTGIRSAITNQFRVMTFNVRDFRGTTTADAQYIAMEKHVARYEPDILAIQEVNSGSVAFLTSTFADDNGYPYTYYGQSEVRGIVLFSKFPITYSELVDSPDGDSFDRPARYIEVDFHGRLFGIYGIHASTWCVTGPCNGASPENEEQRAMELEIIGLHKTARLAQNSRLEFIMMGDFNGDSATMTHQTSIASYVGAPSTVTFPITVKTGSGATEGYPETQLAAYGMTVINAQNNDANDSTIWTTTPNPLLTFESHIDNIAYSSGLSVAGSEIADSEATQTGGITKYGSTLTFTDSRIASDHKAVIADISF